MRRFILICAAYTASALSCLAADLKPDATTDIPESAKRAVVVTADKSQISNLKSQVPKAILPEGLEFTVAAAAPLVTHPIMGCVDDRGRLFIGDATGVNWNKAQLEKNPPNRVLMLEDTDKDGAFDKSTIFADKMTFPQGACWLDGSLYVMSPPGLWKLTDADGDGVAEKREMLVDGFDYTGNAADVHGPFLHPNGRLYWCHGRKGHVAKQKDGTVVHEGLASGIWSCKPDGSEIQWHSLACGDNPVEVDFTPEGDVIGVQNLYYSQPRGDTIVHWLYGGVYERADQMKAIVGLPRTLEHMPVMYNYGHVAVSGCCFARSGVLFGADKSARAPLQFLVTHFNTQRVVRMELTPDGATYKATEHEFLKLPESPDVHFTDVMEDADGTLLVIDTGGWFRIGCPSSLMAKPDIAGAVYRVRKKGGAAPSLAGAETGSKYVDPSTMSPTQIEADLRSDNAIQLRRACEALAMQVDRGVPMGSLYSHFMWSNAMWMHESPALDHAAALALAKMQAQAMMSAGSPPLDESGNRDVKDRTRWEERGALAGLTGVMLMDAAAARAAGPGNAFGTKLTEEQVDEYRHQNWSRLMESALNSVEDKENSERLPDAVVPLVFSRCYQPMNLAHKRLQSWIRTEGVINARRLDAMEALITRDLTNADAQDFMSLMLAHPQPEVRQAAIRMLASQTGGVSDSAWLPPLEKALVSVSAGDLPLLLDAIKKLKTDKFNAKLQAIADDTKQPLPLRLKALDAMKGGKMTPATFALLQDVLTGNSASASARIQAAGMLAAAPLDKTQTEALAPAFAAVGPVELKEMMPIIKKNKDEALLRTLSTALAKNPALSSLQESAYRTAFADKPTDLFENIVLPALRKANDFVEAKKRLLPSLAEKAATKGRAEAGHKDFALGKGTCIACHKIGSVGRPIGPDLSKIGAIRTERDLLESILFPSNTLARDYEAHVIETSDGQSVMGVIKSHTAEGLLVVDVAGQEKTVPHAGIVADTTLTTSLMPMGLDGTLTEQELCDLVAWLRSLK